MDGLECDLKWGGNGGETAATYFHTVFTSVLIFNGQYTDILEDVSSGSHFIARWGPRLGTAKRFKLRVQIQYGLIIIIMAKSIAMWSEQFCWTT